MLQESLESVVRRETFPNSVVDVYINVIEDDGGAITAASLALSLAGIQQLDTLIGCSTVCTGPSGYPLLDPNRFEEDYSASKMTVALLANSGEIAQISLLGECEEILMREHVLPFMNKLNQFYYHNKLLLKKFKFTLCIK